MSNTNINTIYKKFILQIESFLNKFQDKKIQLHMSKFESLFFIEEGDNYEKELLIIHDSQHFNSANDNEYITHEKVEENNIQLFEFIKKCVQKNIRSGRIKMGEGIKKEEWIKYFNQLINQAECKDEYQKLQAYYNGNNSLPADRETLKPDYSLLLVLSCIVCSLFLICLVSYCIKKTRDKTINASNPSGEISLPLVVIKYEEFQNLEL